ncbi:MAG: GNAT family N-acetyltransferase [Pseudomonadota bacterium]|nr:GNAT family N-acetyltransferase [Pseudomonadota bacterium]
MISSLDAIFSPRTVAVVGATDEPGSIGRTLLWNLISNPFGGTVFPITHAQSSVLGIKSYETVLALPESVDLAVIAAPAPRMPDLVGECAQAGVRGVIVISSGFRETGPEGARLEEAVFSRARSGGLRLLGPNCFGIMRPYTGLNATVARAMARPGNVGFVSQSSALCASILDWSFTEHVGFSAFASVGSMLDVGWGDVIDHLSRDPHTRSILIYMESIGDARSLLSAIREVALTKPIIVLKAGRTEPGAKVAAAHTGRGSGDNEVLDAAFRRCGVLSVNAIEDLFYMADALGKQPRPTGPRLTVLTNAGGLGVLATDGLIRGGGELAGLSSESLSALDKALPARWSHANPVEILSDADPDRYGKALDVLLRERNSDGLLVILSPQAMTDATQTAEVLRRHSRKPNRPVLASWTGGAEVAAGNAILNQADIPTFPYPDIAARVFNYMWRYSYNLRGLYETPVFPAASEASPVRTAAATELLKAARGSGRTVLSYGESAQFFDAYGIAIAPCNLVTDEEGAISAAERIGYPVALRPVLEPGPTEASSVAIERHLADARSVRNAFRAINRWARCPAATDRLVGVSVERVARRKGFRLAVGSRLHPQFGPVLHFGAGGQLKGVVDDLALALPPLNTTLARRMMEQTRIYHALIGGRTAERADLAALARLLARFSQLVVEQPIVEAAEIDPLVVSGDQLMGLAARVSLHPPTLPDEELPKPVIRPYPHQYQWRWSLRDGSGASIRPIRPEDEPLIARFHQTLSDRSLYLRYFHPMSTQQLVSHEQLARICFIDYDREMVLVVERDGGIGREPSIVAVARLARIFGSDEAEFAITVADAYQNSGLGTGLLDRLVQIGREEGIKRIVADILPENQGMRRASEKVGFGLRLDAEDRIVRAMIDL